MITTITQDPTYTPIMPFSATPVQKYTNVQIKPKWPKRRTFIEKRVAFQTDVTYIQVKSTPFVVENFHVFINFANHTYRIDGVKFASDIYSFIEKKQIDYVKGCNKTAGRHGLFFRKQKLPAFSLMFHGKLVRNADIPIHEFGFASGATLDINMHMLMGGMNSSILLPTYSHVLECEQEVIQASPVLEVQSSDLLASDTTAFEGLGVIRKFFSEHGQGPFCVKLLEDVLLLINGIVKARSKMDYTIALVTFVKLRMDGPFFSSRTLDLLTEKFHALFEKFQVQSVEETFDGLRDYLCYYEKIRESPAFAKLYKFGMYALSLSLFDKIGVTFSAFNYTKVEEEAVKRKYHMGPDFIHTMLDTLLFLCERGYQCMITGSLDPIFHCGTSYQKWFDRAMEFKRVAHQLSFPDAHKVDRFQYLSDLKDHIDKGESMYKHAARLSNYDKKCVGAVLSDLKLLHDNEITKREAQKERDAPFSVLIYGGSSIGKTTLTSMLFTHYGKVFGLQTGSEYKYTRNANDEFWSGFNSSQWCVQLDDIAFMHPNKASEGDKSVMEMLQVVNNVPFIPAQADLADKGRTPMRAKLVLATTNCADLNAYYYFQTPLAVQRRLPFVIDVTTKEEFTKDGCMLDNSRTKMVEGQYCDYWNYKIFKIVPDGTQREGQRARKELIHEFSDVDDFLAWFSQEAKNHEYVQGLVTDSAKNMDKIEVCPGCYRNEKKCACLEVQATDAPLDNTVVGGPPPTWWETFKYYCLIAFLLFLNSDAFSWAMQLSFRTAMFQRWLERKFVAPEPRMEELRTHFYHMGGRVQSNIGKFRVIVALTSVVVQAIIAYKATKWLSSMFKKDEFAPQGQTVSSELDAAVAATPAPKASSEASVPLSKTIGTTPQPTETERVNVWYKDDFELTTFDVSSGTTSRSTMPHEAVCELVQKNTVFLSTECASRSQPKIIRATCLGGHIYVCNNHGLPEDSLLRVTCISSRVDTGIKSNITFTLAESDIVRFREKDLAFIQILNTPPRKNISDLLPRSVLGGMMKGTYVGTQRDGTPYSKRVEAIVPQLFNVNSDGVCFKDMGWLGKVQESTLNGDCGSILVAETGRGPILLGLHFLGAPGRVGITPLTATEFDEAQKRFARPVVESHSPNLNTPTTNHEVGALHPKSVFRYIEAGSANVYGSLNGFRAAPKSHVVPTVIADAVAKYGYEVAHGKPVMNGWKPWHIAAKEMVNPVSKMDNAVLNECVASFTTDILSSLQQEDLDEIMVYDDVTALNGAAGVAYVDKMNRNTSAGFPWRTSKKHFLEEIPAIGALTEPVEASPEVMERVQTVIEGYHAGRRYMPVFTGHLKDEATKFSKIAAGKTRVFTGAPFDWSLVVRKYLLSFVRVLQRNRFIFEAAPGTNAQSLEWQGIRNHLTKFGEDTMVAGDYAAFDKTMPPCMILAAFDIMRSICKEAGYTPEDLQVIQGIAEDTAFPLVDFNGDLVEFFGSNPSGHPLTVIVNSLANSLYMRYCYRVLNPHNTCSDFQKNVALMTYGDDNVMGVHPRAAWFNHTAIQEALSNVGIRYTMADKEAESVPYLNIKDVSFLKRTWRWDADVGAYLAPLEEASIAKSLTRVVASRSVPGEKQAVDVMSSAAREYFFHGKDIFQEKTAMLVDVAYVCKLQDYLEDSTFPTWEELKDNFWSNSEHCLSN